MKAVVPFPRRGSGRHSTVGAAGILWRTSRQVSPALSAFVLVLALLLGLVSPLNFVAMGAVVQGLTADRRIIWAAVAFLVVVTASRTVLPVISEPLSKELARRVDRQRRSAAQGGVTLLISHRFSNVRMADLILVLDQGRLVERGTHQELLDRRGLYAELFELQARAYQ